MRKAHEEQAGNIRNKKAYSRISAEFDIEYGVAKQLYRARVQKALTQSDIAKSMKTTQSVISRIERGTNVSIETLFRYAKACGRRLQVKVV